jgi:hypothetical protein
MRKIDWFLVKRRVRFLWQRVTRGFSDQDTWSLDWTIAKFVLPRLRRFREVANGYPEDAGSMAGWLAKIDDMIYAIEIYANGHWDAPPNTDWDRVQRGSETFGKYFNHLWW